MKWLPLALVAIAVVAIVLYKRRSRMDEEYFAPDGLEGAPVTEDGRQVREEAAAL